MNKNFHIIFTTTGFGGNEIAACKFIEVLKSTGGNLIITAETSNKRLLTYLNNNKINHNPIDCTEITGEKIIVSSSITAGIKYALGKKIKKAYIYAPFIGSEWENNKIKILAKKIFVKIFTSSNLLGKYKILAPYKRMVTDLSLNDSNSLVIPNVVNHGSYKTNNDLNNDDCINLYCIGRIEFNQKQQQILLAAFLKIAPEFNKKIHLHYIGDGPDEDKLKNLINNEKLTSISPWMPLPISIAGNSIVVLPSRFEGLPLVGLEALTSRIPVIATKSSGMCDFIPEESIFDPKAYETLAAAILYTEKNKDFIFDNSNIIISREHSDSALRNACIKLIENFSM